MRHSRVFPWMGLALLPALATPCFLTARPASAQTAEAAPMTQAAILSLSGDAATISAGGNVGLSVGTELPIRRGDRVVGWIVLTDVKNDTSIGRVRAAEGETPQALDVVALPAAAPEPPATPPAPAPPPPPPSVTVSPSDDRPSYNEHATDIVPWERWEYVALSSLAAHGLLPGYSARDFQATRLFTRGELADLTAKALINYTAGAGQNRDRVFLDRLAHAFRYQPAVRDAVEQLSGLDIPRPAQDAEEAPLPPVPGLSVYGGPRYTSFRGDDKLTLSGRVGGIYDISDKAFLALSVTNLHDRTSALPDAFEPVDVATLNFEALDADWEIGKSYWASGPLMSGDGLLSNNAPGLYMIKGRRAFSWGRFPGKFVFTQLYGGYHDYDGTKYYGLRRVESRLSRRVGLGLGEAYVSSKAVGPLGVILPYYAYQKVKDLENASFNYMAQIDLTYRWSPGLTVYGEYIADDIAAPDSLGAGFDAPRKIAYVLGAHFPRLFGARGTGRFEIYNADREIYLGIEQKVSWSQKDLLLGSPFGPNSRAFYGRLDYRFTDQWKGIVEMRDAVQARRGTPDMGDRFELGVTAAYDAAPDQSVALRVVGQRFRGQGYTIRGTAVELTGTYAY